MRKFYDIENNKVVTEAELKIEYEETNVYDWMGYSFEEYIENCCHWESGLLEEIRE